MKLHYVCRCFALFSIKYAGESLSFSRVRYVRLFAFQYGDVWRPIYVSIESFPQLTLPIPTVETHVHPSSAGK